jgi:anti-anti-sigma factor
MPLKVDSTEKRPGAFVIGCKGSLDTNTYPILEKVVDRILADCPETVIFDMQHLDYISSAGIRVILKTNRSVKASGGAVHLMRLQPQIRKVFEIIQALPSLTVFTSIQEMDQYLDAMQSQVLDRD